MKNSILKLQDTVTSKVVGILWITEASLTELPYPFMGLDYFLDGLLISYYNTMLKEQKVDALKNLFMANHFGKPFFVGHIKSSDKNEALIADIMQVAQKLKDNDRSTIIVLDPSNKNVHRLEKKYVDFKFETLELT